MRKQSRVAAAGSTAHLLFCVENHPENIAPPAAAELYVGALSGTSVDAVDVALVRFGARPGLVATHSLPFPPALRAELLALGRDRQALLATTEKDWVRLPTIGGAGELRRTAIALPIELRFNESDANILDGLLDAIMPRNTRR